MVLETKHEGDLGRMVIQGEVDFYNAPEVTESLKELIGAGVTRIIVDMASVPYMDSTGVAVFIHAMQALRDKKGCIIFLAAQPSLVQVFEMIQMKGMFTFCDTEAAAEAAL